MGVWSGHFSVGFEDAEFDEGEFQQALIDHLEADHTHVLCTRSDIGKAFPRGMWHGESTILRTAPTPRMLLSGAVRKADYKVVLTGEGADDVCDGYDLFREAKVRRFWSRHPASERKPRILERLYPYLKHSPTSGGAFTNHFFQQGDGVSWATLFRSNTALGNEPARAAVSLFGGKSTDLRSRLV